MSADDNGWTNQCSCPVFVCWETNECVRLSMMQIKTKQQVQTGKTSHLWEVIIKHVSSERWGDGDKWCLRHGGDLQSQGEPADDWCLLSSGILYTVKLFFFHSPTLLYIWELNASPSLIWGYNAKVPLFLWIESHGISASLDYISSKQSWAISNRKHSKMFPPWHCYHVLLGYQQIQNRTVEKPSNLKFHLHILDAWAKVIHDMSGSTLLK